MWVKKLSPKKVSNLAEVTQLSSPHVSVLIQVLTSALPILVTVTLSAPVPLTKPRRRERCFPTSPHRAGLCSFLLHSGRQPPGTRMAQRHAWGRVRSHSQDDLAIPVLHQMVNIPKLSVPSSSRKSCIGAFHVSGWKMPLGRFIPREVRQPLYFTIRPTGPSFSGIMFSIKYSFCLVYGLLRPRKPPVCRPHACLAVPMPNFPLCPWPTVWLDATPIRGKWLPWVYSFTRSN